MLIFIFFCLSRNILAPISRTCGNPKSITISCKNHLFFINIPIVVFQDKLQDVCQVSLAGEELILSSKLIEAEIVIKGFELIINLMKSKLKSKGKEKAGENVAQLISQEKFLTSKLEYLTQCLQQAVLELKEINFFTTECEITPKEYLYCEKKLLQYKSQMPYFRELPPGYERYSFISVNQEKEFKELMNWRRTLEMLIKNESDKAAKNKDLFKKHLQELILLEEIDNHINEVCNEHSSFQSSHTGCSAILKKYLHRLKLNLKKTCKK